MKIINTIGRYKPNEAQRITVYDKPFSFDMVDIRGTNNGYEEWYLPIIDPGLKKAVEPLMADIAWENEWRYPDVENAQVGIAWAVHTTTPKPRLRIQVAPPQYTPEQRSKILETASKVPLFDDSDDVIWSEYNDWCWVFDMADEFHKGDWSVCGDEIFGYYDIEMNADELIDLLSFLVCHIDMVLCGGRYLTDEEEAESRKEMEERKEKFRALREAMKHDDSADIAVQPMPCAAIASPCAWD